MNDELALVSRRLEEEGGKMLAFFEGLSRGEWDQQVYVTGSGWKVRDLLAHFVSAERAYVEHIGRLLRGGAGVPADFDINVFNESEVPQFARRSKDELLAALRQARVETLATVASLTSEDLDRRGRHPWFGDTDLRSVLKLLYRHPMIHLRDARRALNSGMPVVPSDDGPAEEGTST